MGYVSAIWIWWQLKNSRYSFFWVASGADFHIRRGKGKVKTSQISKIALEDGSIKVHEWLVDSNIFFMIIIIMIFFSWSWWRYKKIIKAPGKKPTEDIIRTNVVAGAGSRKNGKKTLEVFRGHLLYCHRPRSPTSTFVAGWGREVPWSW